MSGAIFPRQPSACRRGCAGRDSTLIFSEGRLGKIPRLSSYGGNREEQLFNVALELAITWINRILFLKLLEAQLLKYHRGEAAYRFLNSRFITDFDELNELFFDVLARQPSERPAVVGEKFRHIPYLNSSLFEISELEDAAIRINSLKDRLNLPLTNNTVLRDAQGRRRSGELKALDYLFSFLDAYDFSSEGAEAIQEENKTLINASVLGLIFEKINGYRDGSFFTPGFVTMYMCRETLRRAVVQKFRESPRFAEFEGDSFDGLANYLSRRYNPEDLMEASRLVNGIRVCDPAVGSGHFLVSSLNELIAIKSELGILLGRDGKTLPVRVEVENDELAVAWRDTDELFEYRPGVRDSQRVQEALFHEKQTLIENCLFGVDINPNSVKICRLRLWIELLKNAYYKAEGGRRKAEGGRRKAEGGRRKAEGGRRKAEGGRRKAEVYPADPDNLSEEDGAEGGKDAGPNIENQKSKIENDPASPVCYADAPELRDEYRPANSGFRIPTSNLETLPNIDINIRQGNSLVSRFALDENLSAVLKQSKWSIRDYRLAVSSYQHATSKAEKQELLRLINTIKESFQTHIHSRDPRLKQLSRLRGQRALIENKAEIGDLFDKLKDDDIAEDLNKLDAKISKLETEVEEIRNAAVYQNAFEWRFEFPEVLDEEGNFTGFDVVVGNPPYGVKFSNEEKKYMKEKFDTVDDIYTIFLNRAQEVVKENSLFGYIIPVFWLTGDNYIETRKFLLSNTSFILGINLPYDIFSDAYVDTGIFLFKKTKEPNSIAAFEFAPRAQVDFNVLENIEFDQIEVDEWKSEPGHKLYFDPLIRSLNRKMQSFKTKIKDISESTRGILAKASDYSNEKLNDNYRPIFLGKLDRYFLEKDATSYVKYTDDLKEKPADYSIFQEKRIL